MSALCGHCLFGLGDLVNAKVHYYCVLESEQPSNIHLVYLNCAQLLETQEDSQEARKLVLLACKYHSTPFTWFRAGQLYLSVNIYSGWFLHVGIRYFGSPCSCACMLFWWSNYIWGEPSWKKISNENKKTQKINKELQVNNYLASD